MHPFFNKLFTALGVLLHITPATAKISTACTDICLDKNDPNILVTRCSYAQTTFAEPYRWSEFDLNRLFAYQAPYIIYQENGNFSVNDSPCGNCSLAGTTLSCNCSAGWADLGIDNTLYDINGVVCYGDKFGPICGTDTTRTC